MKKLKALLMGAILMSTTIAMAQTPAAGAPGAARPRGPRQPALALTTTAFEDGAVIPNKYTMAAAPAAAVSPALSWTNIPAGTVSFALILNDQDISLQKSVAMVVHWIIFNIPGTARELPEGVPTVATLPDGSIQPLNQRRMPGYMGMGASGNGPYHHYTFELYALDTKLDLGPDATQKDIEAAMSGHIIGKAVVEGRFHMPS